MSPPFGSTADYEDHLVERPAIALLAQMGWKTADCMDEFASGTSSLGRDGMHQVVLEKRLLPALARFNPTLPAGVLHQAIDELTRDRSAMSPVAANRDVYRLCKDGVKVPHRGHDGREAVATVQVIDWEEPANNDLFLAAQFWIAGEYGKKRPDLIGFVNGLPFLIVEFKTPTHDVKEAFDKNISDYKDTIPRLFWYNAFAILSNGITSRVGTITSHWEHFSEWKRISSEGERGSISVETVLRGTCDPTRFLDLIENFIIFQDVPGGTIKLLAMNHQYLGVNNAITALRQIRENQGRLGVFWHTQGSGKSVSMIFFAQKALRRVSGNYTFLVVTDAIDLDGQIYKNFARSGAITEEQAKAESGVHLRQLLGEHHRYIFTLIQKFRTDRGVPYPKVSDRDDIIVITDEAHRSQYDLLAQNMRSALPNAAFIGFTGTPLLKAGEEKTRDVFGDYVSIYDFAQAVADGATVPLYYENRRPELQIVNPKLTEELADILDQADLDPNHERRLERDFARDYHLITRTERLDEVAKDIVQHFMTREVRGKAMVVSIDKATAIRMYDKVQVHWHEYLARLERRRESAGPDEQLALDGAIAFMRSTDMAVVVSKDQNEIKRMHEMGLEIASHRRRMETEQLDERFKDADDPFRIVFVCAMWMTGFDVPSCSTIYLDKPMRNHTLMQTIARANRVFPEKENGLIVDYIGVFVNLQRALAIYAPGGDDGSGGGEEGGLPIQKKEAQLDDLRLAIEKATAFCQEHGIDVEAAVSTREFSRLTAIHASIKQIILHDSSRFEDDLGGEIDAVLINDQSRQIFLELADRVSRLFSAILPYEPANQHLAICTFYKVLAETIRALTPSPDLGDVADRITEVLDRSIGSQGCTITSSGTLDLSMIDVDLLRKKFAKSTRKHTDVVKLRGEISQRLEQMIAVNRTRLDLAKRFEEMIARYNEATIDIEEFFDQLIAFIKDLNAEDHRAIVENLSEEDLAIFDILTKPAPEMSEEERKRVKQVARDLLATLKQEKLQLDWQKKRRLMAEVRVAIEVKLDELPEVYTPALYVEKCNRIFEHVMMTYSGDVPIPVHV